MSKAIVSILGDDVYCAIPGGAEARFRVADCVDRLRDWAERYDAASRWDRDGELAAIGEEMFQWLDGEAGWAGAWAEGSEDRILEINVKGETEADTALLDAPWELLSRPTGPLALDDVQLFVVYRRIGAETAPKEPVHADLQLMFMAASPEGVSDLDYEREEANILEATRRLPLRVAVEESGALEFLSERLAQEGPFEALHLSCHGDIDKARGPVLLLEGPEGGKALAGPGAIKDALGADGTRESHGVASVGAQLAQIMALGGLQEEALGVLDKAEAAFRKLGDEQGLAHVGELRGWIDAEERA